MLARRHLSGVVLCLVALMPSHVFAQSAQEKKAIADSLKQRLEPVQGTVINPETSGYYQIVVKADGFARDALCPVDSTERDALLKAGTDIFNWALRKKKNWGATAGIYYSRSNFDYDAPGLKADAEIKFFTVEQKGANPKNCNTLVVNVGTLYSPLLPIEIGVDPAPTHVELITWFNDQSDQARIEALPKIAGALFAGIGLPPTLLDTAAAAMGTTPAAEIKLLVDSERTSKARTRLYPRQANELGAIAYLGLREPDPSKPLTTKATAVFSIRPISSIFSSNQPSYVSLASKTPDDILNLNIAVDGAPRYLSQELGNNDNYSQILSATTYDVLSSRCDSLFLDLRNRLKLSSVDSAVIVWAVASKHPSLKNLSNVSCITGRANLLAKVEIKVSTPPPLGRKITLAEIYQAMSNLGALMQATEFNDDLAKRFAPKITLIVDENSRKALGLDDLVSQIDRREALDVLRKRFTNIGCFAPRISRPDLPLPMRPAFPPPLADNERAAAAIALLGAKDGATAQALIVSFKFAPVVDPALAEVTTLSIASRGADSGPVINELVENRRPVSCNEQWMDSVFIK